MALLNPSFEDEGALPGEAEHWTLRYVPCEWRACLEALAARHSLEFRVKRANSVVAEGSIAGTGSRAHCSWSQPGSWLAASRRSPRAGTMPNCAACMTRRSGRVR